VQSGFPLTVTLPNDNQGTGGGLERANVVASAGGPQTLSEWFNTAAFTTPTIGTFGNEGNGVIRGPGTINWDMGMSKIFSIRENINLRFRGEFFNVFNHASFDSVDTGLGDLSYGRVTGALSPRLVQLSLVLSF
jgi:hypothetical protein